MEVVSRRVPRVVRHSLVLGAMILPFYGAACSSEDQPTNHGKTPAKTTVMLKPDLSWFVKPDAEDTCLNGGPRPCYLAIRQEPKRESEIINGNIATGVINWPSEAYSGVEADSVEAICYVPNGESLSPSVGDGSSTIWYKLAVPTERIINPAVAENLKNKDDTVETILVDGSLMVAGWANSLWFGDLTANPELPAC